MGPPHLLDGRGEGVYVQVDHQRNVRIVRPAQRGAAEPR